MSQPPVCPVSGPKVWEDIARHHDRLMRLVQKRLPTRQDAEDCVQEAMTRTAAHRTLDPGRLGPFLTSVALRLCADFYRSQNRDRTLVQRVSWTDTHAIPEDDICDKAFGRWLLDRVRTLEGRQREVLLARAAGVSVSAFARQHGISVKSAEAHFTRGRARLRELVRAEFDSALASPNMAKA
ncbi:RNA polymerase sigma factor [Streptomyces rubrogriseus]|uniref:RNA polymerase sigma factor n=1 Tax=Streptomyces rubrogriseus TaxID=194673 RepID=UPI0036FC3FA8